MVGVGGLEFDFPVHVSRAWRSHLDGGPALVIGDSDRQMAQAGVGDRAFDNVVGAARESEAQFVRIASDQSTGSVKTVVGSVALKGREVDPTLGDMAAGGD